MRRQEAEFDQQFRECHVRLPADSIVLAQMTELYHERPVADGKFSMEEVAKALYIVDAAVLNGDVVSNEKLGARLMAAQKVSNLQLIYNKKV